MEFLLIVLVLSVVGGFAVLLRHRRPSGMNASIDEFERNLNAIAPPPEHDRGRRGARRSG